MSEIGKISIRPLSDLVSEPKILNELQETPKKIRKKSKAATTSKKRILVETTTAATVKNKSEVKKPRTNRKDPLPGQMRIDSFYKSAAKSYTIPKVEGSIKKPSKSPKRTKQRRKALFQDDDSNTTTSEDYVFQTRKTKLKAECIIDLCLESGDEDEDEENLLHNNGRVNTKKSKLSVAENEKTLTDVAFEATLTPIEESTLIQETLDATNVPTERLSTVTTTPQKSYEKSPLNGKIKDSTCNEISKNVQKKTRFSIAKSKKNVTINIDQSKEILLKQVANSTSRVRRKRVNESSNDSDNCCASKNNKTVLQNETISPTNHSSEKIVNPILKRISKRFLELNDDSEMEPSCSENIKKATRKGIILSPSDSNVSKYEKIITKQQMDSNIIEESRKLPTPPDSICQSLTFSDAQMKNEGFDIFLEKSAPNQIVLLSDEEQENMFPQSSSKSKTKKQDKQAKKVPKIEAKKPQKTPRPCPPYKIVEGTTFAVDAFRYGDIEGVTHYFLTHFHADHYIGLNRKFSHPLYLSSVTARLLRVFIPIKEEFINEVQLNSPMEIDGVEITAIDANHCPGAVMFVFKTRQGRCILHTGDFRACADMESEPIFWNNDIHTIYLDTTYFPKKYAFCSQSESIDRALHIIEEFNEKNIGTRILYVCGSYLIGKEKFWSSIANTLSLKVWTEPNRKKSLHAINDENLTELLIDDPCKAQMHIIPMVHLSYFSLVEYIEKYSNYFDILFALRPSGWEKDSRPQFRGKVNIIGIEYSEHSSHDELKRFVQYLKPEKVISTVPVSHDAMKTIQIPDNWYKYDTLTGLQHQFQPAITSYFKARIKNSSSKKTPSTQKIVAKSSDQINEMTISPLEHPSDSAIPIQSQRMGQKEPIVDSDTEDDWLT